MARWPDKAQHKVGAGWKGGNSPEAEPASCAVPTRDRAKDAAGTSQGLHGNEVARRNAIRAQAHNQHNYNFVVNTDNKCPAR